jgi:hypothetical protein
MRHLVAEFGVRRLGKYAASIRIFGFAKDHADFVGIAQLTIAFFAGVFSKKLAESITGWMFSRFSRLRILGTPTINYKSDNSKYSYYEYADEGWLEVPFVLALSIYNGSQQSKTIYSPQIKLNTSYEAKIEFDHVPGWSGGTFFSSLSEKAITIPKSGHVDVEILGFARFWESGNCKNTLEGLARLSLNNIASINVFFEYPGLLARKFSKRFPVMYEHFDAIRYNNNA